MGNFLFFFYLRQLKPHAADECRCSFCCKKVSGICEFRTFTGCRLNSPWLCRLSGLKVLLAAATVMADGNARERRPRGCS